MNNPWDAVTRFPDQQANSTRFVDCERDIDREGSVAAPRCWSHGDLASANDFTIACLQFNPQGLLRSQTRSARNPQCPALNQGICFRQINDDILCLVSWGI